MIDIIGTKVKLLRREKNLSQQSLCSEILNRSTLSKIENNKLIPSILQLDHISKVLKIPITYFFTEKSVQIMKLENENISIRDLFIKEKYLDIIELYEKKQIKSNDPSKLYYIATSYFKNDMLKKAEYLYIKFTNYFYNCDENIRSMLIDNVLEAYNTLCKINMSFRNFQKCVGYYNKAIEFIKLYKKESENINLIICNNLGSNYFYLQQYENQIEILEDFLNSNFDTISISHIYGIHFGLTLSYSHIGEFDKAVEHFNKTIFFTDYIKNFELTGEMYSLYITILRHKRKLTEALSLIDQLTFKYKNYKFLEYKFQIEKLIVYFNMNNYEECKKIIKKIKTSNYASSNKSSYNFIVGHIAFVEGDHKKALYYLTNSTKRSNDLNCILDLIIINCDLYEMTKNQKYKLQIKRLLEKRIVNNNICLSLNEYKHLYKLNISNL